MERIQIRCRHCGSTNVTDLGQMDFPPVVIASMVADNVRVPVSRWHTFRCENGHLIECDLGWQE